MAEKELKKLSRADLLELFLNERKDNEGLSKEVEDLKKQLADKTIMIENAGSIAEASLQLNDIFAPAQKAAEQYLENVRLLEDRQKKKYEQMEEETEARCRTLEEETEARCRTLEEETKARCRALEEETEKHCREMLLRYREKTVIRKKTTNILAGRKKDAT